MVRRRMKGKERKQRRGSILPGDAKVNTLPAVACCSMQ
jgi:hypothetical protein